MKFRSPGATPIRVALTSGHTAMVGPEWQELPSVFHYEAVRCGCHQEGQPEPPAQAAVENAPGAMNQVTDYDAAYRQALTTMLEREEDKDFTSAGLPNTNTVSQLCGFSARKEDVLRVYRAMVDEVDEDTPDD